ncbi:permease-like cell division protein FtsX [Actinoplanes sp. NPDC026623]|uniref:permease-like cell division protein FtsX n=1 Tax=Actinoplanes sp. NPDC026623 TaxID=3155610 RepID=UPI0033D188DE
MTNPENVPAPEESAVPAPAKPSARRRRSLLAAGALCLMLVGAAAATGVLLVTGVPGQPMHHFAVTVYLDSDATAEQKAAIKEALPAFEPTGEVEFRDRASAWRRFQEMMKDRPDVLKDANESSMPESFNLETKGRFFDCAGYTKVRHLPGVDQLQVIQNRVHGYGATIICDAEYARP